MTSQGSGKRSKASELGAGPIQSHSAMTFCWVQSAKASNAAARRAHRVEFYLVALDAQGIICINAFRNPV